MTEMEYEPAIRPLPIYLVLDTSSSMAGELIEAVRQGIKTLFHELRSNHD